MKEFVIGDGCNIERKASFWNMVFSMLSALQSAVMIMILTQCIGADEAGILSIAYATGYLMYTIGSYGVRDFHATDSQRRYTYNEYKRIRFLSCVVMIFCSLIYCSCKGYDRYKLIVILLVCALKLVEAVEDLYHGEFQRLGRLDIAGRLGAYRLLLSYVIFGFFIFTTHNLLAAIGFMIILSVIMTVITGSFLDKFVVKTEEKHKGKMLLELAIACFPLFVMLFLSIYISNAPKYAIDKCLSETEQAYYAIISMPVFTINLLSGIVYRPKLLHMAELWNKNNITDFKMLIRKQVGVIILISVGINLAGCTIGLKLLELLYGVSLVVLKKEFAILLLGGGLVAIYGFFSACLIIMRKQAFMLGIAVFIMALAGIIANPMVQHAGLMGASVLYFILMLGELASVLLILCISLYGNVKAH